MTVSQWCWCDHECYLLSDFLHRILLKAHLKSWKWSLPHVWDNRFMDMGETDYEDLHELGMEAVMRFYDWYLGRETQAYTLSHSSGGVPVAIEIELICSLLSRIVSNYYAISSHEVYLRFMIRTRKKLWWTKRLCGVWAVASLYCRNVHKRKRMGWNVELERLGERSCCAWNLLLFISSIYVVLWYKIQGICVFAWNRARELLYDHMIWEDRAPLWPLHLCGLIYKVWFSLNLRQKRLH